MSDKVVGSGPGATILVVDDTPESLRFLNSTLEQAGMTVLIAVDGLGALDLLEHVTPDLILMDAVMPGLDGFKTTRRIKADGRFRKVEVKLVAPRDKAGKVRTRSGYLAPVKR